MKHFIFITIIPMCLVYIGCTESVDLNHQNANTTFQSVHNRGYIYKRLSSIRVVAVPMSESINEFIALPNVIMRKEFTEGDTAFVNLVKLGTAVIPDLIPVLYDSSTSNALNICSFKENFTYNQLAFLIIHRIDRVHCFGVTGIQWCTFDPCGLSDGFLDYVKKGTFADQYATYYKKYLEPGKRQRWLSF